MLFLCHRYSIMRHHVHAARSSSPRFLVPQSTPVWKIPGGGIFSHRFHQSVLLRSARSPWSSFQVQPSYSKAFLPSPMLPMFHSSLLGILFPPSVTRDQLQLSLSIPRNEENNLHRTTGLVICQTRNTTWRLESSDRGTIRALCWWFPDFSLLLRRGSVLFGVLWWECCGEMEST